MDQGLEEGGVTAIREMLRMLKVDRRGATAIEYALIAALIVIAMIAGMKALGGGLTSLWGNVDTAL